MRVLNYSWEFDAHAPPEAMWTRLADTNRFNRDTGIPSLMPDVIAYRGYERHLGFRFFGFPVEWDEEPFEWTRPYRYGVVRRYTTSPLKEIRIHCELVRRADGGTHIIYQCRVTPRNLIGILAAPIQIGILTRRGIANAIKRYDEELAEAGPMPPRNLTSGLTPGAEPRLEAAARELRERGFPSGLIQKLLDHIEYADEISLARIRPFALADDWRVSRRDVLDLCLNATRLGVLDLEWDLLCPLCRGPSKTARALSDVQSSVHCPTCNIDYEVNFERAVELTFHPNPAVRVIEARVYCVGGPEITPHIAAQHSLPPRTRLTLSIPLEQGRYRVRTLQKRGGQFLMADTRGAPDALLRAEDENWSDSEPQVSLEPHITFENATEEDQLFILERWAWSDRSVTAAEVIARQTFRDLFANEALRTGEQFSVGSLTLVFTDLKRSTEMYREIGDAPAFGRVVSHFDVVRSAVIQEDGAVVKTMGDAVMAVFQRPVNALRAMASAQAALANPPPGIEPLALKVGIHTGTCIAVNLNNRLDYFGSSVNIAARIVGQSDGTDILVSDAVWRDPEVQVWALAQLNLHAECLVAQLRGFDTPVDLWRLCTVSVVTPERKMA
jgi:class 3 adenylate cyclase